MLNFDPKRHLPPGWDWEGLRTNLKWGHIFSGVTMVSFLSRYFDARETLYAYIQQSDGSLKATLVPTRTILSFRYLMQGWPLTGMWIFLLVMGIQVWRYYHSFSQGSMALYTMRRLPDKWALHRRCWTQPIRSALAEILLFAILAGLCWLVWYFATPAPCRPF